MLLKTIIVILLIAIIISLGRSLVFLFKDTGSSKRTMHSLGIRVTLAAALVATIVYGFFTGQLEIGAPWDSRKFSTNDQQTEIIAPADESKSTSEQNN